MTGTVGVRRRSAMRPFSKLAWTLVTNTVYNIPVAQYHEAVSDKHKRSAKTAVDLMQLYC